MKISEFDAGQLADRWADHRAVENIMARWVFWGGVLRRPDRVFEALWCRENEPCLGFNHGWYKGREAVAGYYGALTDGIRLKTELAQKAYPDELAGKSLEEIWGVGTFVGDFVSAPLIELAGDGKTAKGLWYVFGGEVDFRAEGPVAERVFGHAAADFIRESEGWKIWHLLFTEDIRAPFGKSWAEEAPEAMPVPEFAALADFKLPEPNVPGKVHERWHPRRPLRRFPALPERYDSFADTFSYGI